VPREAATKLQQLAQQGDAALSRLGILSVQVEGDQVCKFKMYYLFIFYFILYFLFR